MLPKRFDVSTALDRLKSLTAKISSYEVARKENMKLLESFYNQLHITDKVAVFHDLFSFKAINLSGVSLSDENLGEIKEGKYLQIIAIIYDKEAKVKNKNISLGYFGRVEKADPVLVNDIVSFVLRWRFEKSFMTLEHYHTMIGTLKKTL